MTAGETRGVNVCTCQWWGRQALAGATYSVVLGHVVPLVEEGIVGVQLLEVAGRVAMHLYAIRRWRDTLVWAVYLVLGLAKCWRSRLAVLGHAIVEEIVCGLRHGMGSQILGLVTTVCAIAVVLG